LALSFCPITPSFLSDKAGPRRAMPSKYAPTRFLIAQSVSSPRACTSSSPPPQHLVPFSCKTRTTKSGRGFTCPRRGGRERSSRLTQSFSAKDIGGSLAAASPPARRRFVGCSSSRLEPRSQCRRGRGGGGRRRRAKQRSQRRRPRAVSAERTGAPLCRPWPCGSRREREVAE
jgi:hypothetical protein